MKPPNEKIFRQSDLPVDEFARVSEAGHVEKLQHLCRHEKTAEQLQCLVQMPKPKPSKR
jgi:hypothetical protein